MSWQDRFYDLLGKSRFGTINELCKEAGIASSTFGNALKGSHVPKPVTMDKVANALGTTWQYLLNGDEQQAVPNTQVPVLKADQVPLWLNESLNIEDCNKTINAPFLVKRNCFAWRVSTDDMEPEFYRGSYVLLDKSEDYAIKHVYRRLFVLVGIINTPGHFGITDISKLLDHVDNKIPANPESALVSYSDMILCELCKTIQGYQLMSANRRFTTALDRKKHQILAQARYSINIY